MMLRHFSAAILAVITLTVDVTGENVGTVRFEMRDANNYIPDRNGQPASIEYPLSSLMYE